MVLQDHRTATAQNAAGIVERVERAAGRRRYGTCCRVPTPLFHSLRRRTAGRLQISRGVVCAGTLTSVRGPAREQHPKALEQADQAGH